MPGTLPRPSRRSTDPPDAALPALPIAKVRKPPALSPLSISTDAEPPKSKIPISPTFRPGSTSPPGSSSPVSSGQHPVQQTQSTSSVPTLSTIARPTGKAAVGHTTVRRATSVATFPRPLQGSSRISSLPPSPLSGNSPLTGSSSVTATQKTKKASGPVTSPEGPGRALRSKATTSGRTSTYVAGRTPTLLNGSGEGKSISSGLGARGSDGLMSLSSPGHSRSSSTDGSCSTSATTFDDSSDTPARGRDASSDGKRSSSKDGKGNVIVSVRVRPEDENGRTVATADWLVDGRKSSISYLGREAGQYHYDNVFAAMDDNAKVYDASAKRLVRRVMEGYHGTVFAYGMTGTGKTFSMQGTTFSPGVIPSAITDIFSYIRETPSREFLLRVSYLEIYNEKIHDLLATPLSSGLGGMGAQQETIQLREDSNRGVYASPLKEEIVQSPTQLLRVISRGDTARKTSCTQYNARSSRSHAVVQIVVESRERMPGNGSMTDPKRAAMVPGGVRVSTLSLIDLAGSERAAENKERRQEGAHINKSLLTLGTVIARLSGDKDKSGNAVDKDGKHLPYRDSKLTRLLQPALSGDSLVSILCTIQIGSSGSVAIANTHTTETLNTLKFAARAKNNIVSHAKKAEDALGSGEGDAGSRVLLERYRLEISELRGQLEEQAKAQSEGQVKNKFEEQEKALERDAEQRHEEQMLEMQLARTALRERIEHLNRLVLCSQSSGVNASGTASSLGMLRNASVSTRASGAPSATGTGAHSLDRTTSIGSNATVNQVSAEAESRTPRDRSPSDDSAGEYGDGTATLAAQVRALQADVADKNRYISTLEKRLLQARRSSHSRTSMGFAPQKMHGMFGPDGEGMDPMLREKDAEIAELKARLDDKEKMVGALRSAARKRDVADVAVQRSPLERRASPALPNVTAPAATSRPLQTTPKFRESKGGDEMGRLLDEMIQGRLEGGPGLRRKAGSLRLARERQKEALTVETGLDREGSVRTDAGDFPMPPSTSPLPSPLMVGGT
ncbi:MAG: hypothetical protein M1817_001853 [Caeruleum heppii]|nr:MAG: hypothetical protein M1817_001853 [Caeruleum heppii]